MLAVLPLLASVASGHAQIARDDRYPLLGAQPNAARLQLTNFHVVTHNFYRSAQPTGEDLRILQEQYGVRTVISLKSTGNDRYLTYGLSVRIIPAFKLNPQPISVTVVRRDRPKIVNALRALRRSVREGPTLLHCTNGSDRTGLVVALYRMIYENVGAEDAIREMQKYDFHPYLAGIPAFIREVDIAALRRDVGVP